MTDAERAMSMADAAGQTARRLIDTLPAQFLVLVLMNTVFILGLLYFLDHENAQRLALEERQSDARERVLTPLLAACLKVVQP